MYKAVKWVAKKAKAQKEAKAEAGDIIEAEYEERVDDVEA